MVGRNQAAYFNVFDNYTLNVMILPNIETVEAAPNIIDKKYQDKHDFILSNAFKNSI